MFKGTQAANISKPILEYFPEHQRKIVRDVTLDFSLIELRLLLAVKVILVRNYFAYKSVLR